MKMKETLKLKNTLLKLLTFLLLVCPISCSNNQKTKHMEKRVINPWTWQDKFGFVQANEVKNVNRTLYTAGIVSVNDDGNLLFPNNMEKQIDQILKNMEELLDQGGFKLSDVVRFIYYTTDVQGFTESVHVLSARLEEAKCKPATSLIGVKSLFHPECVVEIEATVVN